RTVVPQPAPRRPGQHPGEEDLGVDAVGVLLLEPLLRTVGAGGVPVRLLGIEGLGGRTAVQVHARAQEGLPLDEEAVAAVRALDPPGGVVLERRTHVGHPRLGRELDMAVRRDAQPTVDHAASSPIRGARAGAPPLPPLIAWRCAAVRYDQNVIT